jgi:hypothetical protein
VDTDPATPTDGEAGALNMYIDDSLNIEEAGASVLFISP